MNFSKIIAFFHPKFLTFNFMLCGFDDRGNAGKITLLFGLFFGCVLIKAQFFKNDYYLFFFGGVTGSIN